MSQTDVCRHGAAPGAVRGARRSSFDPPTTQLLRFILWSLLFQDLQSAAALDLAGEKKESLSLSLSSVLIVLVFTTYLFCVAEHVGRWKSCRRDESSLFGRKEIQMRLKYRRRSYVRLLFKGSHTTWESKKKKI